MSARASMRLLQLASQALPIGGFSHSLGLEAAVEAGVVHDEATLATWMSDLLAFCIARYELPLLRQFIAAWRAGDAHAVRRLNEEFLAARETAELRAASVQMGFSLRSLLQNLRETPPHMLATLRDLPELSLPCAWAALGVAWSLDEPQCVASYLWSWAEGQVLAAVKTVPLGQSAGQRVLLHIGAAMDALLETARAPCVREPSLREPLLGEPVLSNFAPALAILSAQHETQYTRLFRS